MTTVKETDVLVTRMDLLLKRLDKRATEKRAMYGTIKAMDSHMMCKVCGSVGHNIVEVIRTSTQFTIGMNLP
jgi:hypothetical protein